MIDHAESPRLNRGEILAEAAQNARLLSSRLSALEKQKGCDADGLPAAAARTMMFVARDTQALLELSSEIEQWRSTSRSSVLTRMRKLLSELEDSFGSIVAADD